MDTEDLTRFGTLLQAAAEQRELTVAELYEIGWLLSEMTRAAAALADHARTEVAALPSRGILREDTGEDPGTRLAEARDRLTWMIGLLQEADEPARRYHAAIGHLGVEVDPEAAED
ncbi:MULTISPECIES: hypothetical protein [Streptosporangium]|uniref:Transcriptional regulator n=1 Tax=Streptosporangium brasiliense TaxID=47480 RepID=A0ABT9RJG5_9ACTN|nr:hypothetical protein [Streptosporangium brasiliense]MDP9868480.1 hypothetical protein [Streptosporangium brasiliense]